MIKRLKALHLTPESVLQLVNKRGYHMMSHDITTHDVVYNIHVLKYIICTCIHVNVSECTIIGRVGVSPPSHSTQYFSVYNMYMYMYIHHVCNIYIMYICNIYLLDHVYTYCFYALLF